MFDVNYTYLNNKLLKILELLDKTYFIENFSSIEDFINYSSTIINNYEIKKENISKRYFSLTETCNIINNYIDTYLIEYKEIINTRFNDGSINFSFNNNLSDSYCYYDGSKYDINISLEHNFKDTGTIIHELFHSLNINTKYPTETEYTFSEAISLFFEYDIYKYMEDRGYCININEIKKERLDNTKNTIYLLKDTFKLINIIKNYGFINKDTFNKLNNKDIMFYDEFDFNYFLYNYQLFIENIDEYNLINGYSYVLGTYLLLTLNKDDINRNKFKLLNDNLNKLNIEESYNILGINIKNKILQKK